MDNKKKIIVVILLLVIILCLIGYIFYGKIYEKRIFNSKSSDETNIKSNTKIEKLTLEQMCPRCKFTREPSFDESRYLYHWNYSGKNQTTLTNEQVIDLYDDYKNLVVDSGKSHFLGVILDNNKIVRAFSCGVIDSVPFCLEGAANDNNGGNELKRTEVFNNNVEIIKKQDLWEGCNFLDHSVKCNGKLDVYIDDFGYSQVSDESVESNYHSGGIACRVDFDGQLYCL